MAGSATVYLEQRVLGHTLGYQALTMPASVWLGLTTSLPSATSAGQEVTGGAYARQQATFALSTGATVSPAMAANSATVQFPTATAPWGTVGWFELWDATTGGNRLYWGPLVDPADGITPITRSVQVGDIMRFQAGVIQVQAT